MEKKNMPESIVLKLSEPEMDKMLDSFQDMSLKDKIFYIIDYPMKFVLKYTIPPGS